jgi:hypothetical protein
LPLKAVAQRERVRHLFKGRLNLLLVGHHRLTLLRFASARLASLRPALKIGRSTFGTKLHMPLAALNRLESAELLVETPLVR